MREIVSLIKLNGIELVITQAFFKVFAVSIDEEILARIRATTVWDKASKLEDFQVRPHENGLVLINLKTGRSQLLYDEDSVLRDWKELFPNVVHLPDRH